MRVLVAFGLLAPPGLEAQAAGLAVRDSAGIEIVENPSRAATPVTWRLSEAPVLAVGGIEDNPFMEFDHTGGYLRGVRLSDGGLAVIDVTRVHIFDAAWKRVRVIGNKGRGPKEFLYLTSICRTRGDTLVVGDSHNRRVSIVVPSGALVRTIARENRGPLPEQACFDDGTFVQAQELPAAKGDRAAQRVTRVRVDGRPVGTPLTLASLPVDPFTFFSGILAVAGQRLVIGTGARSEIEVRDRAGRLTRLVRTDDPMLTISDAQREQKIRASFIPGATRAQQEAEWARDRERATATVWPSYQRLLVDPAGRIWLQDYRWTFPADDHWTIFDPHGRLVGRLRIEAPPKGGYPPTIIEAGDGEVLVRTRDAEGAAWLGLYRLEAVKR